MTNETETTPTLVMTDSVYKVVKFLVQVFLPAVSTLYFTLGNIWDFPSVEQVIGTVAAVTIFLGVLLRLASKVYNASDARFDGSIVISDNGEGKKVYVLELNGDPQDIDTAASVTFKVNPNT